MQNAKYVHKARTTLNCLKSLVEPSPVPLFEQFLSFKDWKPGDLQLEDISTTISIKHTSNLRHSVPFTRHQAELTATQAEDDTTDKHWIRFSKHFLFFS